MGAYATGLNYCHLFTQMLASLGGRLVVLTYEAMRANKTAALLPLFDRLGVGLAEAWETSSKLLTTSPTVCTALANCANVSAYMEDSHPCLWGMLQQSTVPQ